MFSVNFFFSIVFSLVKVLITSKWTTARWSKGLYPHQLIDLRCKHSHFFLSFPFYIHKPKLFFAKKCFLPCISFSGQHLGISTNLFYSILKFEKLKLISSLFAVEILLFSIYNTLVKSNIILNVKQSKHEKLVLDEDKKNHSK